VDVPPTGKSESVVRRYLRRAEAFVLGGLVDAERLALAVGFAGPRVDAPPARASKYVMCARYRRARICGSVSASRRRWPRAASQPIVVSSKPKRLATRCGSGCIASLPFEPRLLRLPTRLEQGADG
jgi:hypothetical protein